MIPSTVHVIVIANHAGLGCVSAFFQNLADQVGVSWRARLLRGPDLDAEFLEGGCR